MTYELRLERLLDAPAAVVFDTIVDPEVTEELFTPPQATGFRLVDAKIDARVGGAWTMVTEGPEGERYEQSYVFTEVDRPRRLAATFTMRVTPSGRFDRSDFEITCEDQDGKTLLTLVMSGFETEQQVQDYLGGVPDLIDNIERLALSRVAG
jgi:glutathione S-transferase